MTILLGVFLVVASVIGGFVMGGGRFGTLLHASEFIIIGGAAMGGVIIMAPKRVLVDLVRRLFDALKGAPHARQDYDDLFMMLFELFLLGRRNGLIALEDHVLAPQNSPIFQRYPRFLGDAEAMEFLCGALRPVIDGKIKPDQLRQLLDMDLDRMEEENHGPVNVMTRAADAMPGFGIVAAVLGIVITMASIAGPIEQIGEKVAAALVGTFLGVFLAYGFMSPLAVNIEFTGMARLAYFRCISTCVLAFAGGLAPGMAIEIGRRSLGEELRPTADELEGMVKPLSAAAKPNA